MGTLEIVTTSAREDLADEIRAAFLPVWPQFIFHDPVSNQYVSRVESLFPEYDVLLLDDGAVAAGAWAVALPWDGTPGGLPEAGYDGAMVSSVTGHENGVAPDTLCVMAAAVREGHQGRGLAGRVLTELRERGEAAGLTRVIAPVRPTLKARYPLTPMSSFAGWAREDGLHLDPWIRAHQRLGATILAPAEASMTIVGTVPEWEQWTGMAFPETGTYVVPRALDVVHIDRDSDRGTYVEPNLWMRHA